MGHDATKALMGSSQSSDKFGTEVFASSPLTYLAGLAVRRNSAGLLSVVKGDGEFAGISMGRSLSDNLKTTILMCGEKVPLLIEATPARGVVTITSYANLVNAGDDTLKVGATTFTFKASPSTESQVAAATSNDATAAALVAKINAHSVAGTLFIAVALANVVTITAKNNATAGSSIDLVYTDSGTATVGATVDHATFTGGGTTAADYVVLGAPVYISNTTGKADDPESDSTISNAIYASGVLSGVQEDLTEAACVLVDFPGGL